MANTINECQNVTHTGGVAPEYILYRVLNLENMAVFII